jgi:hypothetical protein
LNGHVGHYRGKPCAEKVRRARNIPADITALTKINITVLGSGTFSDISLPAPLPAVFP